MKHGGSEERRKKGFRFAFVENLNYPPLSASSFPPCFKGVAFILVSQSANCHPTISHGFLKAVQIAVAPEQPRVLAEVPDALPAAVVAQLDAPLVPEAGPVDGPQAEAAAYKYCAQSAVAEPA
jgi:hypothetical protein